MCSCAARDTERVEPRCGTSNSGNPSGDRSQPSRAGVFAQWTADVTSAGGAAGHPHATLVRRIRARIEGMTSDEQSTAGPSEETKRKFREALDRKNKASKQREGESHLDGGGGAQHTQGPADHKREFRRKSG